MFTFMDNMYSWILMHDTPRATAWGLPGHCVARCTTTNDLTVEKKRNLGMWYKMRLQVTYIYIARSSPPTHSIALVAGSTLRTVLGFPRLEWAWKWKANSDVDRDAP